MDPKRYTTRAMLQRGFTLNKQPSEQQPTSTLTVPTLSNWHRQSSTNSDAGIVPGSTGFNPSPRGPTYALGPQRKFDLFRAQKLLQVELNRRCAKVPSFIRYEPKQTLDFVRDLSQQLRRVIKPEMITASRYKVVVLVTIVQTTPDRQVHQSIAIASRCLWDRETDGSVTVQAKLGADMLAIATVYAVYTD